MGNAVEINQLHHAKLMIELSSLADTMGDHRDSVDYYNKIEKLADETIEKLSQIVLEEL